MVFFIKFDWLYETHRFVRYNYKIKFMARAMFEYTKTILKKVSFNSDLFCKELKKSLDTLLPYEIEELTIWLKSFIENKPELSVCMIYIK